jgi:hypothetical protein
MINDYTAGKQRIPKTIEIIMYQRADAIINFPVEQQFLYLIFLMKIRYLLNCRKIRG